MKCAICDKQIESNPKYLDFENKKIFYHLNCIIERLFYNLTNEFTELKK